MISIRADENQLNDALVFCPGETARLCYYVDETGDEMAMGNAAMALEFIPGKLLTPWN